MNGMRPIVEFMTFNFSMQVRTHTHMPTCSLRLHASVVPPPSRVRSRFTDATLHTFPHPAGH